MILLIITLSNLSIELNISTLCFRKSFPDSPFKKLLKKNKHIILFKILYVCLITYLEAKYLFSKKEILF